MSHKSFILNKDSLPTFNSVNIDSVSDWGYNLTSEVVRGNTEGQPVIQGVFVDNQACVSTINVTDVEQFGSFTIGQKASLVLPGIQREPGAGGGANTFTVTLAYTVLVDANSTVPHAGESNGTMTFESYDTGAGVIYVIS